MIHARGLSRTFDTKHGRERKQVLAVQGVDLDVEAGEIVGFLGPNGAGKTTTLRMLTTLLKPTAGTATVAGFDVATQAVDVRRSIGYVSQSGSTSPEAQAGEEIVDHGMLYGISKQQAEARGHELFEQLDLGGMWTRQPRTLSGGQRRRLDIAMGLVHDPKLVFLDEPTTGLDPSAREALWGVVQDVRRAGSTIVLTTHYLEEAERHADRIGLMHEGVLQREGTLAELVGAHPSRIRFAPFEGVEALPLAHRADDDLVTIETAELQDDLAALLGWAAERGVRLDRLSATSSSLEDVFRALGAAQPARA